MAESMQEFYSVLDELVGDQSVEQVRLEFEKLLQALRKSRDNEKRLMSKCRELNAEIVSSSTKVSAALQLSQEDQTTITSLKRVRYTNAWSWGSFSGVMVGLSRSWIKHGRWWMLLMTKRRETKRASGA